MIYYPSHEIFRYQKLPHAFQTLRISEQLLKFPWISKNWLNTSLYLRKTKLIKHYWSDLFNILIVPQFIVNQPSDKRILHISNIWFILHTQANPKTYYKLSNIEKNGIIGILLFFLQNYLSPVDSGRKNFEASIKFGRSCFTNSRL